MDHRQRPHKLRINPDFKFDQHYVDRVMRQVRKAGVAEYIDERLHSGAGSTCDYRSEVLITGLAVSVHKLESLQWTSVTKTLAAFPPQVRYYFGLTSAEFRPDADYRSPSYRSVSAQVERLLKALDAGWVADDGTVCDLDWFGVALTKVNIPAFRLKDITAATLDGTAWEARAAYAHKQNALARDKAVAFGIEQAKANAPLEPPVIKEAVTGTAKRQNLAGTKGLDGRKIYTADPDARGGYRTATSRHGNMYIGYESHLAGAAGKYSWRGQPDRPGTVSEMPPYILAAHVTPAGWHTGRAGTRAIDLAKRVAPNIDDVCADRLYTMKKAETFLRPMHEQGINVTMDFPDYVTDKAEVIEVQAKGRTERFVMHCGTLLHMTVPNNRRILDLSGEPEEVQARFNERARQFRWTPNGSAGEGSFVFQCPYCGRRAKNVKLNPETASLPNKVAPVDAPEWMTECCGGYLTVGVELLDHYQKVPYGTTAHAKSKGRRSGIESINNNLKTNQGLNRDFLAAFGLAAHRFAMAILVFAHNFELMMNDPEPVAEGDEDVVEAKAETAEFPVAEDEVPESVEFAPEADELGHPPPPT